MFSPRAIALLLCLFSAPFASGGSYGPGTSIQLFDFPNGTTDLADGSTIVSDGLLNALPIAGVFDGALRLAHREATNSVGAFKLPELDPGNVARTFDLRFAVLMNAASATSAGEGWSVNFGDIPLDAGTGEGGFAPLPGGLTIAFDTHADNEDDAPSIEIFVGGTSIANFPRDFAFDLVRRAVSIHWDASGLDLSYDNRVVCTDLPTPGFAPRQKFVFAFSARTTTNTADILLDEVRATTTTLPVIETGGPIISEFVANNGDFEDEFADKSGWLELFNGSNTPINLGGWYLTDSKKNLTKWRIPELTLNPYNYQLVFASGRDRQQSATSFLHAGFTLAKSGGYVALVKPDGTTVASSYEYGPQDKSVSFGEKGPERKRGYMFPASPGAVNVADPAPNPLAPPVHFSNPGGVITEPVVVSLILSNAPAGAEIRYTLDRTEPGLGSPVYTNPITVTQFTTIRARAYLPEYLPGSITRATYVMLDGTLTNYAGTGKVFDSNLPLLFLDSFGVSVDGSTGGSRPFRPTYALVIPPDPVTGRASLTNKPDYNGYAGTHVRGESSAGFEQKSYSLEFWDENGKDLDASILGLPEDSDWVLNGPWSEKTLMRNKLIFDWMLALRGHDGTAVRTRFVEVFFNQLKPASGRVGYSSYRGVYILMEKLKRGKERVPLENLNEKTIDPQLVTGGYIIRKDKDDTLKTPIPSRIGTLQSFEPDRLNPTQLAYVKSYLTAFETALYGANFRNFTNGYLAYIDPDTFIDAQWMVEIAKQIDGYVYSTYWHKDRAGRLRAGPLWDFNIAIGNADYGGGDRATGWLYDNSSGTGQLWYPRLHADPDYRVAHWDRYWQLRRSLFRNEAVTAIIDQHMNTLLDGYTGSVSNRAPAEIQNPVARQFRKYARLGLYDWPNAPGYAKRITWQQEVEYMKNWLSTRLAWLDDQSLRSGTTVYRPPIFSLEGGVITEPVQLAITPYQREDATLKFPLIDIYYTVDGSDPRLPGGELNSSARKLTGSITVDSSLTVNARLYNAANPTNKLWSPLATATFLRDVLPANSSNIVISEIMFRPAALDASEASAGVIDFNKCEFIELRNISPKAVDLTGAKFTAGIDFDFNYVPPAKRLLKPGESAVLVADSRAFRVRYPFVPQARVLGQYAGNLDSGGETLQFLGADGSTIKEFRYDDDSPWPSAGESSGRSILLTNPAGNPNPADPARWTMSEKPRGTPGASGAGGDLFTGAPFADTDRDGETDYFEFLVGSDPENPQSVFRPSIGRAEFQLNGSTNSYVTFAFTRNPARTGVRFVIERSDNLSGWTPAESTLVTTGTTTNEDGTLTETYRGSAAVNAESTARFYRLKALQQ